MDELIKKLKKQGVLKSPQIIEAFKAIDRADFVLPEMKYEAYGDYPLSIGRGQTISQPYTVAFMLELLDSQPGQKILDIGFGSGWQTTLLAYIVSKKRNPKSPPASRFRRAGEILNPKQIQNTKSQTSINGSGKVVAMERIKEIYEFGKKNIAKYNFLEKGIVECILGDGSKGYKKEAPYDRIVAAAAGEKISDSWKKQLKVGGIIVSPVKSSIIKLIKIDRDKFKTEEYGGFSFVPLIEGA